MSNIKFQVKELTKDFGHGRGIFDISFNIEEGEVLGFLGPNGAGKSTTIRNLMGFTKPDKGYAEICGLNVTSQSTQLKKFIGYLPGEVNLPEDMSIKGFINTMKVMNHLKDDRYLNYLIDYFKFDTTGTIKRMSVGNKRKLAVITALMTDPEILILDEPTSGLDPAMQDQFINLMVEEKERGKTILLSSHIFKEVDAICDRIIIVKEGKIISRVDANTLKNASVKTFTVTFSEKDQLLKAQKLFDGKIDQDQLVVKINQKDLNNFFKKINGFSILSFKEERFDLEKYFLDFYRTDRKFKTV